MLHDKPRVLASARVMEETGLAAEVKGFLVQSLFEELLEDGSNAYYITRYILV